MIPFYDQLMSLGTDTTLFEVWAREQPEECGGSHGIGVQEDEFVGDREVDPSLSLGDRKLQTGW